MDKQSSSNSDFASRAGQKLEYGLKVFNVSVKDLVCADLGCSTGGFVDCLLRFGARKVYAVDTGYGVLDWKLRNDKRVVVMERTNALFVELPEKVDFISVDVSWTRQDKILPQAYKLLKTNGRAVSLIKPHYEAPQKWLIRGQLDPLKVKSVLDAVLENIDKFGFSIEGVVESPIKGKGSKNTEFLVNLKRIEKVINS
ncbi:TlyA family rRNA (cytidine-2'-O)-methyltransferase [Candidatus Dojkabacteria bacterium]|nr:TlyA family rRNA (cytidine-2'-O)-methyltransferase [Candidatus Dojkabacteria bacterium]